MDSIGSTSSALAVSAANAAPNGGVQAQMSVGVLKKAQQVDADSIKQLIASATGVGQRLDVTG